MLSNPSVPQVFEPGARVEGRYAGGVAVVAGVPLLAVDACARYLARRGM